MSDRKRLIEVDFPLEQVSLDSVHEKNVRHGHISTLHIWPARRPLAACRAALIATLLPDPGNDEERKAIYRRLAGEVVEKIETKKVGGRTVEVRKRETRGGILHWGRESGPDLDWFREKIRVAHGGRAPKVLDPFAGGGAIPLEAMRLGCEATAIDINPVAWFILKCTLEYPQKLAGQTRPLPEFALKDRDFMEAFLKAKGFKGVALKRQLAKLGLDGERETEPALIDHNPLLEADLAWQVRAWGRWVLAQARRRLALRYPTYAEYQAPKPDGRAIEPQPLQLLEPDAEGNTDVAPLNGSFSETYLKDPRNPRWIAKPTVAYLWARTVRCKGCRATVPLLKTRWLAKKDNQRVVLTMTPNAERTGVVFGVEKNVPQLGGNAAQRRENDKRRGAGTMTQSGAQCPCCPTIMTGEDIRIEGQAARLAALMTAVVVQGQTGKEYRHPMGDEIGASNIEFSEIENAFSDLPFGIPHETISPQRPSPNTRGASGLPRYGLDNWSKLNTSRQLFAMGTFATLLRCLVSQRDFNQFIDGWKEAIFYALVAANDKTLTNLTSICSWNANTNSVRHTFARFALPMVWDYVELSPIANMGGSYGNSVDWVAESLSFATKAAAWSRSITCLNESATSFDLPEFDCIITDPPYYDAIPYSDLMDFYHVWLRRCFFGLAESAQQAFSEELGPKWNHANEDGELVDQPSRFLFKGVDSKNAYEHGMARAFRRCHDALSDSGRLVIVFANKQASAWETLAGALIKAGFVVDGSWPIQTERASRSNALTGAALASSVWLICKKRSTTVRAGWDNAVLVEMRERIHAQLRTFWDSGIRGPDFVWAATGPALEAFSKYPVVKKADEPNAQMTVSEFLREVRRLVVDFVVGRVLTLGEATDMAASLDDVTTYYLLHRNDFGLDDAPIGACILYALSCNLSDGELAERYDILSRTGGTLFDDMEAGDDADDSASDDDEEAPAGGKGNRVRLKEWKQRKGKSLGYEAPGGRPVPLIDQAHRLMHLWRAGDQAKVDDYLDTRGLKRNALFAYLLQALIELSKEGSEERALLESLSTHLVSRGGIAAPRQIKMEV